MSTAEKPKVYERTPESFRYNHRSGEQQFMDRRTQALNMARGLAIPVYLHKDGRITQTSEGDPDAERIDPPKGSAVLPLGNGEKSS